MLGPNDVTLSYYSSLYVETYLEVIVEELFVIVEYDEYPYNS